MTDSITKTTLVKAPIDRVWRAISDHNEFGQWFKVDLDQAFVAGQRSTGKMTYPGFEGFPWLAWVTAVEEPNRFAFDWVPGDQVPADPETAARTSVEFRLAPEGGGTRVTIVESGFGGLPFEERESALRGNTEGWTIQTENLREYAEARAEA